MREVFNGRGRIRMAQHALRREDDQRFAPVTQGLAAQQVKILCGVRGLRDLNIVLGAELQKALNAGAGVLRPLAFVAVRQKQDKTGKQVPFGFAGGNELVDDGLCHIYEITELRFPKYERFRIVTTVAVFEAENALLGKS